MNKKEKVLGIIGIILAVIGLGLTAFGIIFFLKNLSSDIGSYILYGAIFVVGFLIATCGALMAKPFVGNFISMKDNRYSKSYTEQDKKEFENISSVNKEDKDL